MIIVKIRPLAPTKEPATISTLLSRRSPANAAAIPDNEFNKEITTGISPPPIGNTKPIPASRVKTRRTVKKSKSNIGITGWTMLYVKKINDA